MSLRDLPPEIREVVEEAMKGEIERSYQLVYNTLGILRDTFIKFNLSSVPMALVLRTIKEARDGFEREK